LLLHTWQLGGTVRPEAEPWNRAWRAVGELAALPCLQNALVQVAGRPTALWAAWRGVSWGTALRKKNKVCGDGPAFAGSCCCGEKTWFAEPGVR